MKLIGLMPVRNEAWVLGISARVALKWCDELVILVHASTDGTVDIAADLAGEFPARVCVDFQGGDWDEMAHRQRLLDTARGRDATHIAIVDADEILTANLLPIIRPHVEALRPAQIMQLPGYNLRGSLDRYHANGIWGQRTFDTAFVSQPLANWQGDQFHHRAPFGIPCTPKLPIRQGCGGVLHLWGASERRLAAKHALYKITERLRWPEKRVRDIDAYYNYAMSAAASAGTKYSTQWTFAAVPPSWWEPYADLMGYLDVDAEPWQEAEARKLYAEHGAAKFAGLDLFGVV